MRWLATPDGVYESPTADVMADTLKTFVGDQVFWLDIEDPDLDDYNLLRDELGVHPLTLEQIRRPVRRPAIDDHHGYTFLDVFQAEWRGGACEFRPLYFYVSRNYIVSVHVEPETAFNALRNRLRESPELATEKPAFLQFLVLDQLVDRLFLLLDEVETSITGLERSILIRPTRRSLSAVYELKQKVTDLGKMLSAQREVFQHLITHSIGAEDAALAIYYRDIYEHIVRQAETADNLRDLCNTVMEVYMSGSSNRLNVTMKQLTMITALFLPLSAVTGFFGMNHTFLVDHIAGEGAFLSTLAAMVLIELGMVVFFWRAGWLS